MYDELLAKHGFVPMNHVAPQFFPVQSGKVYDDKGHEIPGYQRIFRGDTGDSLAVHSSKYTMVPYERHFSLFEEAIKQSQLNTAGMMVGTDMSDNGAKIFRQYLFPNEIHEIEDRSGIKHPIALRIPMWDSYDGSHAFVGKSGWFNFACANEAMIGKTVLDVRFKHTGAIEQRVEKAAHELVGAAQAFIENINRMKRWTVVPVKASDLSDTLASMPQGNPRLINELVAEYARGENKTLWDVSQLLTNWATHDLHRSKLPKRTAADRQKRVSDLVESVDWVELERRA